MLFSSVLHVLNLVVPTLQSKLYFVFVISVFGEEICCPGCSFGLFIAVMATRYT